LRYAVVAEIIVAQPCPCEKLTFIMLFTPKLAGHVAAEGEGFRSFCGAGRMNVTSAIGEPTEPVRTEKAHFLLPAKATSTSLVILRRFSAGGPAFSTITGWTS
jgi:hypothetical protein